MLQLSSRRRSDRSLNRDLRKHPASRKGTWKTIVPADGALMSLALPDPTAVEIAEHYHRQAVRKEC